MPHTNDTHPPTPPDLVPAPLFFSPRPSHSVPHIGDADADVFSVGEYRYDDVFWNSALEEGCEAEGVPRGGSVDMRGKGGSGENGSLAPDGGGERSGDGERSASQLSNWDLYAPRTPSPAAWPVRGESLRRTRFELRGERKTELLRGRSYDANVMRGGGEFARGSVEVEVPLHVVGGIVAFAEADPAGGGAWRGVDWGVSGGGFKGGKGGRTSLDREGGQFGRRKEAGDVNVDVDVNGPGLAGVPDIADHPAFRNGKMARGAIETDDIGDGGFTKGQEQERGPMSSRNGESAALPTNGFPHTDTADERPPSTQKPASREPNDSSPSPSPTPPPHTQPTEDETQEFLLRHHSRPPSPTSASTHYPALLAAQASSIRHLNALITDLTSRADYYEHDLLPRTLTHWSATNAENHALSAALHRAEEENAGLWDMLEFSRRLLLLCWRREEAVLGTARIVRARKGDRAKCAVLERLVNSFGVGRGAGKEDGGVVRSARGKRAESPFREDLEQLVFVCEQNMKVFAEDLEDWGVGLEKMKAKGEDGGDGEEEGRGGSEACVL